MSSSTFSSETRPSTSPGVWLRLVAHAAWPTLVAALLVVGAAAAGLGYLGLPAAEPTMESAIIAAQLARAATLQDVDVLIVGDSSALMGVDASLLSQRLGGRRVESLALIAWVGPEGQIQVAESVGRRRPIGQLVYLLNRVTLRTSERGFSGRPYDAWVRTGHPPARRTVEGLRDFIYGLTLQPFVARPLPGRYGQVYGFAPDLQLAIADGHGTVLDPARVDVARPVGPDGYVFNVSPAFDRRLDGARDALARLPVGRAFIGITPIPASSAGPQTAPSRQRVVDHLRQRLGQHRIHPIETPSVLPDAVFATATHVNAQGRAALTEALARALGDPS